MGSRPKSLVSFVCIILSFWTSTAAASDSPLENFESWLSRYVARKIPLEVGRNVTSQTIFNEGIHASTERQEMEEVFLRLEETGTVDAVGPLLQAATVSFRRNAKAELERDRRYQPWRVRRRAERALSRLKNPDARDRLRKITSTTHHDAGERIAAIRALGIQREPSSVYHLSHAIRDEDAAVRAAAAEALGLIQTPAALAGLIPTLGDREEIVRIAGMEGIESVLSAPGRLSSDKANRTLGSVYPMLDDRSWRVRLLSARVMRTARSIASIAPLIAALTKEQPDMRPDFRGRVRTAFHDSLRSLTGAYFPEDEPQAWADWWAQSESSFRLPRASAPSRDQNTYGRFFNIPVDSTQIIFVIDSSGSMNNPMGSGLTGARRQRSKWERAVDELTQTLEQLDPEAAFNIVLFGDRVTRWHGKLKAATAANRTEALKWMRRHSPNGGTDLFGGLSSALSLASVQTPRELNAIEADTVFLLSDGEPTVGRLTEMHDILAAVRQTNELASVRVNTISFGGLQPMLMAELARQNDGTHRHIPN